jgi:RNA polymerase sigma-70 factor (ECF subfamily)
MSGAPAIEIEGLVDDLFRREAGRLTAVLTRWLGVERMDLAEDLVQETLLKALRQWPYKGVPDNPSAWLLRVAKNAALDVLRREKTLRAKIDESGRNEPEPWLSGGSGGIEEPQLSEWDVEDDQLRLMFTCCHPALSRDSQVALVLKTLCGFGVPEIANAYLSDSTAVAQRIVRAKRTLKEHRVSFVFPIPSELRDRLDALLQALYLLFNEGYSASSGGELIRLDLCKEAIYLMRILVGRPPGDAPKSHALLALMLFQASRLPARTTVTGDLLLLEEQDRSAWDRALIGEAFWHLQQSASGDEVSTYHLEAGIASMHAMAASYEKTDWATILELYDQLLAQTGSAVVALNRAVALAMVQGPQAGLDDLDHLSGNAALKTYYLYPAVRAALEEKLGRNEQAIALYTAACSLVANEPEKRFLIRRIERLKLP